jgi:hypothetical protein
MKILEATAVRGPTQSILVNPIGVLPPTVTWITNTGSRSFGYLDLQVTPCFPGISALTVDYGSVPFPPWPLEARVRAASTVFWNRPHETGYELTAGIRVVLGDASRVRAEAAKSEGLNPNAESKPKS